MQPKAQANLSACRQDLIFDIGMHHGDDSAYYLALGFRVIAVEANYDKVRKARLRFRSEIGDGRLRILPVGVTGSSGVLPFYLNLDNDHWDSFNRSWAGRFVDDRVVVRRVRTITAHDLVSRFGVPYFAKIDVEGMDHVVVEGLMNCGARPQF